MRTFLLACVGLAFAASAGAQELPANRPVGLFTRDGSWKAGKWSPLPGDSLKLEGDRKQTRIARADIARAWTTRRDVRRHALSSGVTSAIGGAFVEAALGGSGIGNVAKSTAIAGGIGFAAGGLMSVIFGNDAWEQRIPAPAGGHGDTPFPAWAGTVHGGIVSTSESSLGTDPAFGFTIWAFHSPSITVGAECGALSRQSFRSAEPETSAISGRIFEGEERNHLVYATTQVRLRFARTGLRPQFTFGFGEYFSRDVFHATVRDTTGAVTEETDRQTSRSLGLNLGFGLFEQQGDLRPGIEVRGHWPVNAGATYYTIAAALDFR
jgi:hypothetical protein